MYLELHLYPVISDAYSLPPSSLPPSLPCCLAGAKREARAYSAAQLHYKSSLHSSLSFDEDAKPDAKPADHLLALPLSASASA